MVIRWRYALIFIVFVIAIFACDLYCVENHVEFRPVLSEEELEGKAFDVIRNGKSTLYIWKLSYLSDRDLEKVEIMRSATRANKLIVVFRFNKDGLRRLYRFTKKFAKRRVAIFTEGKLATAPLVWIPNFMGDRVVTDWPGSEKELLAFSGKVNHSNPSVISLYIEEQNKYQETASDAWAEYYANVNKYLEDKRGGSVADSQIIEADRDF